MQQGRRHYMTFTKPQQKSYLERIGYTGEIKVADAKTLIDIVERHIFTFPFETTNIHNRNFDQKPKTRADLTPERIFRKLVTEKRGGICYELNMLLQGMLQDFGFDVMPLSTYSIGPNRKPRSEDGPKHAAAIVSIGNDKYLIDSAFGFRGMLSPLLLEEGEVDQFGEKFRIIKSDEYEYEYQGRYKNEWVSCYGFDIKLASRADYTAQNIRQTNPLDPNSYYQARFVCTLPVKLKSGQVERRRIVNEEFSIDIAYETKTSKKIKSQAEFHQLLKEHFGIDLKGAYIRHHPIDMLCHKENINPPTVLHHYNTRQRHKYLEFAKKHTDGQIEYDRSLRSKKKIRV